MSSSDSDSENGPSASKKLKVWRKQKFNHDWLQLAEFNSWLRAVPEDEYSCRCVACNCTLSCGKSELQKHSKGKKHLNKVKLIARNTSMDSFFKPKASTNEDKLVQNFEMRLCAFFAEHNVALQIVDHLVPLLKEISPDSAIIRKAALGRQKCTSIIKNVLAPSVTEELVNILKVTPFSILIDESTDIGLNKTMCLLVRFIGPTDGKIHTRLLELIHLNEVDCTAEYLYSEFKKRLSTYGIPIKNVIGMASDGASVMVGKNNSFSSRLLQDNSSATVIKCVCHISAIITTKACLVLPRAPEDLIRQIYSYFSGSSKRCLQLEEMQEYFNYEKKKILRVSSTRWLSLQKCIERVLDNWEVLKAYFRVAVVEDKLKSAELILSEMDNECVRAYLLFLKYVLNYFNSLNALFQSKKPLVQELYTESKKIFIKLAQNFIKPEKLHVNVNVHCPENYVDLENLYLGHECNNLLSNIGDEGVVKTVKTDILNFYIEASAGIQERLPINDDFFQNLIFLKPEISLNKSRSEKINFEILCKKMNFSAESLDKISEEWRILPSILEECQKKKLSLESVEDFWHSLSKMKNFDDSLLFPNLTKLAEYALTLPHANADSERIFSIVTDVRTKKRNKLSHEALNAICVIRSHFQDKGTDCTKYNWETSHSNIHQKMRSNILYDHKKK